MGFPASNCCKEDTFELQVYIIEDGEIDNGLDTEYVRFIDEKNYLKNAGLYREDLTEEQIISALSNGGLPIASIWYTNETYADFITGVFENIKGNTPVSSYTYSSDDVKKLHDKPQLAVGE